MLGTLFKTISLLNLLLVFTFYSHAQYYSAGQDPASQRWRQINTSSFKLIYPETWENKAHKLAGFLEIIKEPISNSLPLSIFDVMIVTCYRYEDHEYKIFYYLYNQISQKA